MYSKTRAQGQPGGDGAAAGGPHPEAGAAGEQKKDGEDVVDADFKEVK